MKVIEPVRLHEIDWQHGDILVMGTETYCVAKDVNFYPVLINLDTGESWCSGRATSLDELTRIVKSDVKGTIKHYPKSQYRMYLEAP